MAKDAAEVREGKMQRAEQHVAVGETFDFEYRAVVPGEMRLEALSPNDNRRSVQTILFGAR